MKWMDHPGRVGPRPNAGAGQRRSKVPWRLVRGRGGKPRVAWGDGGRRVGSVVISWWDWTHGESLLARERVSGLASQSWAKLGHRGAGAECRGSRKGPRRRRPEKSIGDK